MWFIALLITVISIIMWICVYHSFVQRYPMSDRIFYTFSSIIASVVAIFLVLDCIPSGYYEKDIKYELFFSETKTLVYDDDYNLYGVMPSDMLPATLDQIHLTHIKRIGHKNLGLTHDEEALRFVFEGEGMYITKDIPMNQIKWYK